MPETTCSITDAAATPKATRRGRAEQVDHLSTWRRLGISQRAYAQQFGLPPETLRDWVVRSDATDADHQSTLFFDSPTGLLLLKRIFVAAMLVMNLQGSCGLRRVGQFFELAGLSPFVASSYGILQQHSAQLHTLIADFGQQQSQELGQNMPKKDIVVCEDETFLASGMTLVAIEPVSGFLLAEACSADRTAQTWNTLLDTALKGYNVSVVAQCSDGAAALQAHAQAQNLPHNPDLWHVLHDINAALVLHLARLYRDADEPARQTQVSNWQQTRAAAVKRISDSYHPYDLETGLPVSMACVLTKIDGAFCELEAVAAQSNASASSLSLLAKARRVVPQMVVVVDNYHIQLSRALEDAEHPERLRRYLETVALPVAYLRRIADAASTAEKRELLLQRAHTLSAAQADPRTGLPSEEQHALSRWVSQCVSLFCRGSSCVEGRNGALSLYQHAHRRLLPSKRVALKVAHNFLSTRDDGTTAAQRFFEQPHKDLFEWVLQRMPVPPRPAASRAKSATPTVPVA